MKPEKIRENGYLKVNIIPEKRHLYWHPNYAIHYGLDPETYIPHFIPEYINLNKHSSKTIILDHVAETPGLGRKQLIQLCGYEYTGRGQLSATFQTLTWGGFIKYDKTIKGYVMGPNHPKYKP